jgi:glucokinase
MCGCGHAGHLEAYASATAIVERTREALSNHHAGSSSILNQQISEDSPLSALMISQAASAGDELAVKMVEETAAYLGTGIAMLAHVIDPQAFILGGAMDFGGSRSPLGQKFLADVAASTRKQVFPVLAEKLVVEFAALGGDAGYIGAAGLARQAHNA